MTDPRPACGNSVHAAHCIILRPLKLGFRSFYFSANSTIHAFGTVSVWHWKHRKVECNAGCQCTHNAFGNCGKIWFKHTMWEQNVHITYVKMASICTHFVYRLCKIWGQSLFLQKFPGLKPKMVPRRGSDIPRLTSRPTMTTSNCWTKTAALSSSAPGTPSTTPAWRWAVIGGYLI